MTLNPNDLVNVHFHRRKDDPVRQENNREEPSAKRDSDRNRDKEQSPDNNNEREKGDKCDKGGDDKEGKDSQDDKSDKKSDNDDQRKKMPPAKKKRLIIIALIVGLIVIIGGICYWLYARNYETTDDAFIDGHVSQVSPQAGGRIQSLLIIDNQQVEAGQVLAEIDPRDYQERLSQAEAQHAQALAQLALQQANLGQAKANVEVAAADVYQADQDLKRYSSVNPEAITKQQFDNALSADRSARAKLDASRQAVDAASAQVDAAQANVLQTDVDISNAKLQLSYTKITAPIAGRITRRTVEVGNVVSPGMPLLAVVSNDLWVTANYKETQLDHMRIGQPVTIKVDAFPGQTFHAHVDSFQMGSGSAFSTLPAENATGNYIKVVQRIPVKIVFDDASQRDQFPLAPGMSVDPSVTVR